MFKEHQGSALNETQPLYICICFCSEKPPVQTPPETEPSPQPTECADEDNASQSLPDGSQGDATLLEQESVDSKSEPDSKTEEKSEEKKTVEEDGEKKEAEKEEGRRVWYYEELKKDWRKFNLDLMPKVIKLIILTTISFTCQPVSSTNNQLKQNNQCKYFPSNCCLNKSRFP